MTNPNPYASPGATVEPPANFVDRLQRNELAALVRRFLDGQVDVLDFEESLDDFFESSDSAVHFVAKIFWRSFEDDFPEFEKTGWDYAQRLLLLLESDNILETTKKQHWSWMQFVAGASLLGYLCLIGHLGWQYFSLAAGFPFGVVSLLLFWRRNRITAQYAADPLLFPFDSFAALKAAYDSAPSFHKRQFPRDLNRRESYSRVSFTISQSLFYLIWMFLSPIALFFQMFPSTETRIRATKA